MASIKENTQPREETTGQQSKETCIQLLNLWLADETGYDEANWPKVKSLLEENRTSKRSLFNE